MSFGSFESGGKRPMADINTTPLVDVMLVLLIIFIITAPLMTQTIKVDLPKASAQPSEAKPDSLRIAINVEGQVFLNEEALDDTALLQRLADAAQRQPQPELHLSVDSQARYQRLAEVMAAARQAGLSKMGFITLPDGGQ